MATIEMKINPASAAMNAKAYASVKEAAEGHPSVLEPKLDGWRLLAHVREDGVRLYTRTGNDKTAHLPHICEELAREFPVGTWVDGEAVAIAINDDGMIEAKWGSVQSVLGGNPKPEVVAEAISFCVFDLLAFDGNDIRPLPFKVRRDALEKIFAGSTFDAVTLVAQADATEENHEAHLAAGFEGSMVKWLDAPYRSGVRGMGQGKLKGQASCEVIVMGGKPGKGQFDGMVGAVIFGQYKDGKLVERGKTSGMDYATRQLITHALPLLVQKQTVFEITHNGAMPSGALRHPRFLRFREDKTATEVTWHD